jgi:hypothetical protein
MVGCPPLPTVPTPVAEFVGALPMPADPNLFEMPGIVYSKVTCKKYVLLIYATDFSGY